MMKVCVIFDLDGVLVESLAFERSVGEQIVLALSRARCLPPSEAEDLWRSTLRNHWQHPRWHDYSLHCSVLGLADEWKRIHEAFRRLIHPLPKSMEAIRVGRHVDGCWLASDATSWVVEFKLHAVGLDPKLFDEVFTLDRCRASKGDRDYWSQVQGCIGTRETHLIYVDNRHDRLAAAAKVLTNCSLVQVIAEDHPTSLGLFSSEDVPSGIPVRKVASSDLPELLQSIIDTVQRLP